MTTAHYVGAYILSIAGGWLIAGVSVYLMRISVKNPREFFRWIDIWVGGTERAVATTLIILAPRYLPAFIGAWVALKFAANWQRQENKPENVHASLVALVGSVISFSTAIAAGLLIRPEAVAILNEAK